MNDGAVRAADAAARHLLGVGAQTSMMGLCTWLTGQTTGNITVILSPPVNLFARLDLKGQWRNWFTGARWRCTRMTMMDFWKETLVPLLSQGQLVDLYKSQYSE